MGVVVLRDLTKLTDPNRPHSPRRPLWTCRQCGSPWPCLLSKWSLLVEFRQEPLSLFGYLGAALFEAAGDLFRLSPNPGPYPAELHRRFLGWVPTERMIRRALAQRVAGLPAHPAASSPPAVSAQRQAYGGPGRGGSGPGCPCRWCWGECRR
ncbi:hypothetical protein AAH979_00950 [Plantactinospora sp. ZYX-F-223]|uniref:hypothetical protein n=1 Tax=Plantactinospora sp. ZYX-F-223 TaxID=3144103 RepID=UPI0031FE3BD7